MIIIWAVSFTAVLVIGFGITAIVLGSMTKTHGANVRFENIFHIEYRNMAHQMQLVPDRTDTVQPAAARRIINYLNSGGRTNRLNNLFRGSPTDRVERNNTGTSFTSVFDTAYSNNSLIIWFNRPDQSVRNITATTFELVPANGNNDIHGIMIPLNRVNNRFQSQTWFLITSDPNQTAAGSSMQIANIISTYGNYSRLWRFINELFITF